MTREEFIALAKEYGYTDADIKELLDMIEEAHRDGVPITYEVMAEMALGEQLVY